MFLKGYLKIKYETEDAFDRLIKLITCPAVNLKGCTIVFPGTDDDERKIVYALNQNSLDTKEDSKPLFNNKSFQSLWHHIDDIVNCKECTDRDKIISIQLILNEMHNET